MGDHHHHHHPRRGSRHAAAGDLRPPEPPLDPLEFLSRSWSASASALDAPRPPPPAPSPSAVLGIGPIAEDAATAACEVVDDGSAFAAAGSSFSFASAATSQLIMERILAQSVRACLTSSAPLFFLLFVLAPQILTTVFFPLKFLTSDSSSCATPFFLLFNKRLEKKIKPLIWSFFIGDLVHFDDPSHSFLTVANLHSIQ